MILITLFRVEEKEITKTKEEKDKEITKEMQEENTVDNKIIIIKL